MIVSEDGVVDPLLGGIVTCVVSKSLRYVLVDEGFALVLGQSIALSIFVG